MSGAAGGGAEGKITLSLETLDLLKRLNDISNHPLRGRDPVNCAVFWGNAKNRKLCTDVINKSIWTNQPYRVFFVYLTESKLAEYGTSLGEYVKKTGREPIDFTTIYDRIGLTSKDSKSGGSAIGASPARQDGSAGSAVAGNGGPNFVAADYKVSSFVRDVNTLIHNALLFNPPKHAVHEAARELGHKWLVKHIPYLRRSLQVEPEYLVCFTCGSPDSSDENQLAQCDNCCLWYHQHCVGADQLPPGSWYCPACVAATAKLKADSPEAAAAAAGAGTASSATAGAASTAAAISSSITAAGGGGEEHPSTSVGRRKRKDIGSTAGGADGTGSGAGAAAAADDASSSESKHKKRKQQQKSSDSQAAAGGGGGGGAPVPLARSHSHGHSNSRTPAPTAAAAAPQATTDPSTALATFTTAVAAHLLAANGTIASGGGGGSNGSAAAAAAGGVAGIAPLLLASNPNAQAAASAAAAALAPLTSDAASRHARTGGGGSGSGSGRGGSGSAQNLRDVKDTLFEFLDRVSPPIPHDLHAAALMAALKQYLSVSVEAVLSCCGVYSQAYTFVAQRSIEAAADRRELDLTRAQLTAVTGERDRALNALNHLRASFTRPNGGAGSSSAGGGGGSGGGSDGVSGNYRGGSDGGDGGSESAAAGPAGAARIPFFHPPQWQRPQPQPRHAENDRAAPITSLPPRPPQQHTNTPSPTAASPARAASVSPFTNTAAAGAGSASTAAGGAAGVRPPDTPVPSLEAETPRPVAPPSAAVAAHTRSSGASS